MGKTRLITRLILCFVLILTLFMLPLPAAASESPLDKTISVSTTAGTHGYYSYDMETDAETFVPPLDNVQVIEESSTSEVAVDEPVSPAHVIGADDRKIVSNPTGEKSTICLIGSRYGSGTYQVEYGTAWLLNKNNLVTAAHVIYSNNWSTSNSNGSHYAQHVAVYVGASGGKFSHYRLAKKLYVAAGYRDAASLTEAVSDDWGVITLDSSVNSSNIMGLKAVNSASGINKLYTTAGYPYDLNENVHDRWDDYDMYKASGYMLGDAEGYPAQLDVIRRIPLSHQAALYGQLGLGNSAVFVQGRNAILSAPVGPGQAGGVYESAHK